jgi:hypothetical protein
MRIDFGASFKEVSRLLRASTTPSTQPHGSEFDASLKRAVDGKSQLPGSNGYSGAQEAQPQNEYDATLDMRASYKFTEPGLELPILTPQSSPIPLEVPAPQSEPIASTGVKTPTVLEVRRVEMAGTSPTFASVDREGVRSLLKEAGAKFGVSPSLSMAVVRAESDFNPRAVSSDGHASKGLFQLLDSTGKGLLARGEQPDRTYDPFDPQLNVELGTTYLRYLHDIFSTTTPLPNQHSTTPAKDAESLERLAVAAFNAGEGRVAAAQARAARAGKDPSNYSHVESYLPKTTQTYVERVVANKHVL